MGTNAKSKGKYNITPTKTRCANSQPISNFILKIQRNLLATMVTKLLSSGESVKYVIIGGSGGILLGKSGWLYRKSLKNDWTGLRRSVRGPIYKKFWIRHMVTVSFLLDGGTVEKRGWTTAIVTLRRVINHTELLIL